MGLQGGRLQECGKPILESIVQDQAACIQSCDFNHMCSSVVWNDDHVDAYFNCVHFHKHCPVDEHADFTNKTFWRFPASDCVNHCSAALPTPSSSCWDCEHSVRY